jgi:glycosyltransferase involved in cell wall biosynthesis
VVPPQDEADEAVLWREGIETARLIDYGRLLRQRNFAVAIASRPEVAPAIMGTLRRHRPRMKIIFDMVDAYFVRLDREYAISGDAKVAEESKRMKKVELELVRQADLVWCNSSEDRRRVQEEVSGVEIEVIPTIHVLRGRGKPFAERRDLFFVGQFAHRPNADGIKFFLSEVFPLVKRSLPQVQFHVAGTNPPREIQAFASSDVHVLGFVPDIEPYFQSSRVFVAPVRFGAGVKGKVGDSLSYGLPLVTTSIGAEGMGLTNREQAMIADSAEDFARAVVELYQDRELWQRLSDNGYAHVEKNFGVHVVEDVVKRSIEGKFSVATKRG